MFYKQKDGGSSHGKEQKVFWAKNTRHLAIEVSWLQFMAQRRQHLATKLSNALSHQSDLEYKI